MIQKINNKANILILLSSVSGGGAQSLVLAQMKYFNKERFKIFVISLRTGNMYERFNNQKSVYYSTLNTNKRFSLNVLLKLLKFIKENRIDIIHTHLLEADYYGFLLKVIKPNIHLFSTRHGENKFRKKIQWGIFNFVLSLLTKRIICVSNSLYRFVRRYEFIPKRKLILIYNGIDVEYFKKEENIAFKNKIKGIENNFIIGIVGRLKLLKGHEYLFRAVAILKKENVSNIKVLVLGEGPHKGNLISVRNQLNISKEIEFLGFHHNTKDYYNSFDLLCLPSNYEGLPLVLIEAMACESLVLCSDIPNNLEVVDHGINGITFKKSNVIDLARQIKAIIDNEYNIAEIKKRAREKVVKNFNFIETVRNWEKLYSTWKN